MDLPIILGVFDMTSYRIRKVKYVDEEETVSYRIDEEVEFDCYGVYLHTSEGYEWLEDFNTLEEAEDYLNSLIGVE